jgi:hypothetical protein
LEQVPAPEGTEVLILLPERSAPYQKGGVWERIKQGIARELPDLLDMTAEARQSQFERLSATIAECMPYGSLEEFERAMRGDEYGLVRY